MFYQELPWRERGRLWMRLLIRLLMLVALGLLFAKIGLPLLSFCAPFVGAVILTWLLEPLVRFLVRKTVLSRKAVSIILILLICGLLGGVLFWFGYKITVELMALLNNWSVLWGEVLVISHQLTELVRNFVAFLPDAVGTIVLNVSANIMNWLQDLGTASLLPKTTSFAIRIPWVVLSFIFFLMGTYFIMADFPRIGAVVTSWMPINLKAFVRFVEKTFQAAFGGYIRAQLLLSMVVFFILVVGFTIMHLNYGLLLAFILAVLDFIPIIGAGTIMVPWAIVDMALGKWEQAIFLFVIWGIIVLFRRIAEPRFLGSQTGLHPVLSLVGIYVGMKAWGVPGMILTPILFLVILNICRSGVFDGFRDDVISAFQDISAFLQNRWVPEPLIPRQSQQTSPPEPPPDTPPSGAPPPQSAE